MIVKMSLKNRFDTTTSISRAFCEQTGKPISRKTVSRRLTKEKNSGSDSLLQTFDFKEKSSWLCHSAYRVDRGTMECFTLVMTLNSTYLDPIVRGLEDVKMRNTYILNALRKQWNLEGRAYLCEGWFLQWVYGSLFVFTVILMPVFIKNFITSMLFLIYAKEQLKLQYLCKETPCNKAKTVLSFLEEEGIAVMKWPPQTPDMNPLENVWKIIGEKAQSRNP